MRCESEVSRVGKCNNFRLTLVTDKYYVIQSNPLFELIHHAQLEAFWIFHLVLLTSTICDSVGMFIPWTEFLSLGTGRSPKGQVGLFGLSLRFFHTERCFCFWSSLSRLGSNFAVVCLMFTSSLKMHYTCCVMGLMLYTLLIIQCLFSWMT